MKLFTIFIQEESVFISTQNKDPFDAKKNFPDFKICSLLKYLHFYIFNPCQTILTISHFNAILMFRQYEMFITIFLVLDFIYRLLNVFKNVIKQSLLLEG